MRKIFKNKKKLKNYHSIAFSYYSKLSNALPLLYQTFKSFESICSALS